MSSRQLKRLLAEKEKKASPIVGAEEEEEEQALTPIVEVKKPAAKFSALLLDDESGEEDEDDEPKESAEKRKDEESDDEQEVASTPVSKKSAKSHTQQPSSSSTPSSSSSKNKKKKNKKKTVSSEKGGLDEIDLALQEIAAKYGSPSSPSNSSGGGDVASFGASSSSSTTPRLAEQTRNLLSVDKKYLNADAEMRRIFGSKVINSEQPKSRGRVQHLKKAQLVYPRTTWPPFHGNGVKMEPAKRPQSGGSPDERWFKFIHSPQYQELQLKFFAAVRTFNPDNVSVILQINPYHIDALLQFSDMYKMGGDMQIAAEFVERALFGLESVFHSGFNVSLGTCRLDYNEYENRCFFLAMFRHVSFVAMKGCWRTALECTKLLLSLAPDQDPLGAVLMIDYFALRAQQYSYLRRMYSEWDLHRQLSWLPNFAFSVPLAAFMEATSSSSLSEDQKSSLMEFADEHLQNALLRFPQTLLLMAEKCSIVLDDTLAFNPLFLSSGVSNSSERNVDMLVALFVNRNFSLWKVPEVITWLTLNAQAVLEKVEGEKKSFMEECQQRRKAFFRQVPLNIQRHVRCSEIKEAIALLPSETSGVSMQTYDPMPPSGIRSVYDDLRDRVQYGAPNQMGAVETFLRSLLPGFDPQNLPDGEGIGGLLQALPQQLRDLAAQLGVRAQRVVDPHDGIPDEAFDDFDDYEDEEELDADH